MFLVGVMLPTLIGMVTFWNQFATFGPIPAIYHTDHIWGLSAVAFCLIVCIFVLWLIRNRFYVAIYENGLVISRYKKQIYSWKQIASIDTGICNHKISRHQNRLRL